MAAVENSNSDQFASVESNQNSSNSNVNSAANNVADPDFDIYAGDNEFAEEYETRADGADLYDDVIAPSAGDELLDTKPFIKPSSGTNDSSVNSGSDSHGSASTNLASSSNLNNCNHASSSSISKDTSSSPSKRISFYIGNLSWWTNDMDVLNAISSVGVADASDVKFFENRANGQSKGFCVVTLGSDASFRIVMEKLPKVEIHGQNPVVTPCNRQSLNHFEMQSKKQTAGSSNSSNSSNNNGNGTTTGNNNSSSSGNNNSNTTSSSSNNNGNGSSTPNAISGISTTLSTNVSGSSSAPVHHMPPGNNSSGGSGGPSLMRPRGPPYPTPSGPAPGSRPPLIQTMPRPLLPNHPRGPMPGSSGSYSNSGGGNGSNSGGTGGWPPHPHPGPPHGGPRGGHPPPPHSMVRGGMGPMQRPPRAPGGGLLMPPGDHRVSMNDWNDGNGGMSMGYGIPPRGGMGSGSSGPGIHGGHPSGPSNVHLNPAFIQPSGSSHPSPSDYRGSGPPSWSSGSEYRDMPSLSEQEIEEIYAKNRSVTSSSISRAVQDVTEGNYTAATDTLNMAITLIKQSKISHDERCKLLITSLQDTLNGIEAKAYNVRSRDHHHHEHSRRHSSPRDHHRDRMDHSPRRSPRSRSPKRSRRSRSREYRGRSRDRGESSHRYRGGDDYDNRDGHRHRDDRDRRDRRH